MSIKNLTQGPCPTCGGYFKSRRKKKYCCVKCFTSSQECKDRLIARNKSRAFPPKACASCGVEILGWKKRKFCSTPCYRKFMAERFDRWIASPQEIALPQCFDEFLSQPVLQCLVKGCDWSGTHLGNHINLCHGISAEEFKRIAGFNKSSGLVTPAVAKLLSDIQTALSADRTSNGWIPFGGDPMAVSEAGRLKKSSNKSPPSLESKEHKMKAIAVAYAEFDPQLARRLPCRTCNAEVIQPAIGRKWYCSSTCRNAWRDRKQFTLECSECRTEFLGSNQQKRAAAKGKPVVCSIKCRCNLNIRATPNHRKHLTPAPEAAPNGPR